MKSKVENALRMQNLQEENFLQHQGDIALAREFKIEFQGLAEQVKNLLGFAGTSIPVTQLERLQNLPSEELLHLPAQFSGLKLAEEKTPAALSTMELRLKVWQQEQEQQREKWNAQVNQSVAAGLKDIEKKLMESFEAWKTQINITLRQECLAEMKKEKKTSSPKHQALQATTVTPVVRQQTLVEEPPKPTVAETKEMDPLYLKLLQEMKAMRATLEETKEKNSPCPSLEPLSAPTGVQPPQ